MDQDYTSQYEQPRRKKSVTWIYVVIIFILLGTNIYLFTRNNKKTEEAAVASAQIEEADSARVSLQEEYNASLARLDELTGQNSKLDQQLKAYNKELAAAMARIEEILKKKNASALELSEARGLIERLNGRIARYEKEIERLKTENITLTVSRDSLRTDNESLKVSNEDLQHKVSLAKVLHASNIRIVGVVLGRRKEKETSKAKRVDVLRIVFDIDENRVAENGNQTLNVRILNPSGTLLSNAALGSGEFVMAESRRPAYYSVSKSIPLQTGQSIRDIKVDWQQSAEYEKGNYTIEIYNQGFLIGKNSVAFR